MSSRIPVACLCCGRQGQHAGRGLIVNCHERHREAGTLDQYPLVRDNPEWRRANRPPQPPAPAQPADGWAERAACRTVDPEIFWPPANTPLVLDKYLAKAKLICRRCPVRQECLQFALATDQRDGIWAATTPPQRIAMRTAPQRERTPA